MEKGEKGGKYMKHEMDRDKRFFIILAILIVASLLASFWAVIGPLGSSPEIQGWERWNLTFEQRREIMQLMEDMRRNGASFEEIQAAVEAKLDEWGINMPPFGDIEFFYTVKTVISTINVTLGVILLAIYIDLYRKTKSDFTIILLLFSVILLFYTITSSPIMQWIFGFRAFGLGPFAMLPDLFVCIALSIMLYLSLK
jgi:hypothetical protein